MFYNFPIPPVVEINEKATFFRRNLNLSKHRIAVRFPKKKKKKKNPYDMWKKKRSGDDSIRTVVEPILQQVGEKKSLCLEFLRAHRMHKLKRPVTGPG